MYCSGCGQALSEGQAFCPQCGRPVAQIAPPFPGLALEVENYRGRVKALAIVWFAYAGLSLALGMASLAFVRSIFSRGFGPWIQGPPPPDWLLPAIVHFAWLFIAARVAMAALAGWALMSRAHWGRIVAIIIAFLSLLHFPVGTALGIWTLVMLMGFRNSTLYEQM